MATWSQSPVMGGLGVVDIGSDWEAGFEWFWYTLRGTNISHLGKRKIFKSALVGVMLVPWRVLKRHHWSQLTPNLKKGGQMLEYPSSNNSMMVRVSHYEAAGTRAQLSMSILWPVGWPVGIGLLSGVLAGCPANKYVASCWFASVPFWKPSGKTHPITPSSKLRHPSRKNAGIQHQLRSLTIVAEDDVPCLQQIQWSAG